MPKYFIVLFLLFCLLKQLYPQKAQLEFEHISVDPAFPSQAINAIVQDKQGFLWFATNYGLVKYNGYDLKTFLPSKNKNSISDEAAFSMIVGSGNILWIGASNGINKYNCRTNSFQYFPLPDSSFFQSAFVEFICLYEEDSSNLLIGTAEYGLLRLNTKSGTYKQVLKDSLPSSGNSINTVNKIAESPDGNLWIATHAGILIVDPKKDMQVESLYPSNLPTERIFDICFAKSGQVWVCTNYGLYEYMQQKGEFKYYHNRGNSERPRRYQFTNSIVEDKEGSLWLGTYGITKFDVKTGQFYDYRPSQEDITNIWGLNVNSLFLDYSDVLWIGTDLGGLNKLNLAEKKFYHYCYKGKEKGLNNNWVSSFANCNSKVLVGTFGGGISIFDAQNASFEALEIPKGMGSSKGRSNWVHTIFKDSRSNYWIGTKNGLFLYLPQSKQFSQNFGSENNKVFNELTITSIAEDKEKALWFGTERSGIIKLEANTGKINFYPHKKAPIETFPIRITKIYCDKQGIVWVGTFDNGLFSYNPTKDNFEKHPYSSNIKGPYNITSILQDSLNRLWVGSYSEGLHQYNKKTKQFTTYSKHNGLIDNNVAGIIAYKNELWISTETGISKFNADSETFINYGWDNLKNIRFNYNAAYKDKEGWMYFGGYHGFNMFHPEQIGKDTIKPQLAFTELLVSGKAILAEKLINGSIINLKHYQNDLDIEFAALQYQKPELNKYAYRLENYHQDWKYVGQQRKVSFTNLKPGTYVFRMKASNHDGAWNEKDISFQIKIATPPWKTWWAYATYILITASIIYFLRTVELKRLRLKSDLKLKQAEAEQLEKVDRLKTEFFTNITHELRTPLSIILGSNEKLKKNATTLENQEHHLIKKSALRLINLINQILEYTKFKAGFLNLEASSHNIVSFIKIIADKYYSLAEEQGISFTISNDEDLIIAKFDEEKLVKIIDNLLSNAFKFTPKGGEIKLSINKLTEKGLLEIAVQDSGAGIATEDLSKIFDRYYQAQNQSKQQAEGTGIGLAMVKDYVELHKGNITAKSKPQHGSVFIIQLPILIEDQNLETEEKAIEDEKQATPEQKDASKQSILIVEDNADLRLMLHNALKEKFYVIEAPNGLAGLKLAIKHIPELIISDIMMPKLNGIELCQQLKKDERTSHIPFILLTAKVGEESKIEGLKTGADDYVVKPFNVEELSARIENLIQQRIKLRELYRKGLDFEPKDKPMQSMEQEFLQKVSNILEEQMQNSSFTIEQFAAKLNMSRVQLYRKIQALTGCSPNKFLRNYRLKRAAQLIKKERFSISEVAFQVGFSELSYFSKCFKEYFNCSPTEYLKK